MAVGATVIAAADDQEQGLKALIAIAQTAPNPPVTDFRNPPANDPAQPRNRRRRPSPLAFILAAQIALSARLIWSNTAFQDEALYLWAGRAEIAHWLTGSPVAPYPVYFSGAPVLYPPLGALAASIGGLYGARLLSLAFMLGATGLLHGITRRIFDRRAAMFAAALFAATGAAQFLGAFATYDAMALFLLAMALWLGVCAAGLRVRGAVAVLVLAGMVLAAANATKYASALFDPTVIAAAGLVTGAQAGWRAAVRAGGIVAGTLAVCLAAAAAAGGGAYWHGIELTTLSRPAGTATAVAVLYDSGEWVGIIAILAIIGAAGVTLVFRNRAMTALGWVLAATCLLAPAEQARIHTLTSLFKHVGFGALFACVIAGAALAYYPLAVPRPKATRALRLSTSAAFLAALVGFGAAGAHFAGWPDSRPLAATVTPLLQPDGRYLAEDDDVLGFEFDQQTSWQQWTSTWFFRYADPRSHRELYGQAAYAAAIRERYFNVVILAYADTLPADRAIRLDMITDGGYRLARIIPYRTTSFISSYQVWVRR